MGTSSHAVKASPEKVSREYTTGRSRSDGPRNYIVDTMKAAIIRIGNSRGVRIPKALLEQCGLADEVEMEVRDGALVISNPAKPRQGWEAAFAAANRKPGKDDPLDRESPTAFDLEEWEW
jgi:antitoxin MazE